MAKFSRRDRCDIYCTRLPGRIFERLDRDEVDRETLKVVRAMRCRDFRDWSFDDDVDDRIRRRTLPVIKARAGEYRDSNGSLCNPTLFATRGRKETCTRLRVTTRFPLPYTYRRFSVGRNKSRLANTGRSIGVLLHSRDRSVGTCHVYLQRKVYSLNSRFLFRSILFRRIQKS